MSEFNNKPTNTAKNRRLKRRDSMKSFRQQQAEQAVALDGGHGKEAAGAEAAAGQAQGSCTGGDAATGRIANGSLRGEQRPMGTDTAPTPQGEFGGRAGVGDTGEAARTTTIASGQKESDERRVGTYEYPPAGAV